MTVASYFTGPDNIKNNTHKYEHTHTHMHLLIVAHKCIKHMNAFYYNDMQIDRLYLNIYIYVFVDAYMARIIAVI